MGMGVCAAESRETLISLPSWNPEWSDWVPPISVSLSHFVSSIYAAAEMMMMMIYA